MEIKKTVMGTGMGLGWIKILGIPCLPHPAGAPRKVAIRRHHWEVAKRLGFTHTGRWGDKEKEVPNCTGGYLWVVPPPKTCRVTVLDHGSPEIDGKMEVRYTPDPPKKMKEEVENFLQKHPVVGDRVKILNGASQWLLKNPGHCTYWGGGVPELRGEDNATVSQSGVENGFVRISLPNRYLKTFGDLGAYIELPKEFIRLIFN